MARLPGKWLETTVLVAGLLLLGVTLQKIGLAGLLRDLSVIGWGLAVILLVSLVAALSSLLPAIRSSRVQPTEVLRNE